MYVPLVRHRLGILGVGAGTGSSIKFCFVPRFERGVGVMIPVTVIVFHDVIAVIVASMQMSIHMISMLVLVGVVVFIPHQLSNFMRRHAGLSLLE